MGVLVMVLVATPLYEAVTVAMGDGDVPSLLDLTEEKDELGEDWPEWTATRSAAEAAPPREACEPKAAENLDSIDVSMVDAVEATDTLDVECIRVEGAPLQEPVWTVGNVDDFEWKFC